jgi:hypothetical protein
VLGHASSKRGTVASDYCQDSVEMRQRSAGREHALELHDHTALVEVHLRVSAPEQRRKPPRGGGRPAVEHARLCQEKRCAASGGTIRPIGMPLSDELHCVLGLTSSENVFQL